MNQGNRVVKRFCRRKMKENIEAVVGGTPGGAAPLGRAGGLSALSDRSRGKRKYGHDVISTLVPLGLRTSDSV